MWERACSRRMGFASKLAPTAPAAGVLECYASLACTILAWSLGVDMTHEFDVIVEKDSAGYFVASVPALPGCHTQAKSLDDLMERIREAIELCLEVQGDVLEPLDFVGVQRISVAA